MSATSMSLLTTRAYLRLYLKIGWKISGSIKVLENQVKQSILQEA